MAMTEHIWQLRLLAQGGDADEWMNILFIVVVAVIWVVGGIVKAAGASRKNRPQEKGLSPDGTPTKRETLLDKLAKKAEEIQRAVELQANQRGQRPGQQAQKPPKRPAGRINIRTGPGGESLLVFERQPASPPVQREPQRPQRRAAARPGQPRTMAEPATPAPHTPVAPVASEEISPSRPPVLRRPAPARTSSFLPDYGDADALKRAILHAEILGKPLAVRDPSEIWRF